MRRQLRLGGRLKAIGLSTMVWLFENIPVALARIATYSFAV